MKKTYNFSFWMALSALLWGAFSFTACTNDEPQPTPEPPVPSAELTLNLSDLKANEDFTFSFTLSSANATTVRWMCVEQRAGMPESATVLAEGEEVEANKRLSLQTATLTAETDYLIVAVATNGEQVLSKSLEGTTLAASKVELEKPSFTFVAGEATESTLAFTLTSKNADQVKWVCIEKGSRDLTVEQVLKNGSSVDANAEVSLLVEGLLSETTYTIYAAASNAEHQVLSEPLEMTTLAALPPVENFVVEGSRAYAEVSKESLANYYVQIYDESRNYTFKADIYVSTEHLYLPSGEYPLGEMAEGFTSQSYTSFLREGLDTKVRKFTSGSLIVEATPDEATGTVSYYMEGEFELEGGGIVSVIYEGEVTGISLPKEEEDLSLFTFEVSPSTSEPVRKHYDANEPGTYTMLFVNANWSELIIEIKLDPALCNNGNDPLPAGTYTMESGDVTDYSQVRLYTPDPYFSCNFSSATVTVSVEGDNYTIDFEGFGTDPYASTQKERTIRMNYTGEIKDMVL